MHVSCAAPNPFLEDEHFILNHDVGLPQVMAVYIMYPFQNFLVDTARVQRHGMDGDADRVVLVGVNPLSARWESCADVAIEERLNAGYWGGPFIRQEDLVI